MGFLDKLLGAVQLNDEGSDFVEHDYYDDEDIDDDDDLMDDDANEDDLDDGFYEKKETNRKFADRFRSKTETKRETKKAAGKYSEIENQKEQKRKYIEEDDYEDELDDLDNDDYDLEEEMEDRKIEKSSKEPLFRSSAAKKTEKSNSSRFQRKTKSASAPRSPKITQMRSSKKSSTREDDNMEVCVIRPSSVENAKEIADALIDECIVLLNLEGVDTDLAQRIFDIATGACYALNGALTKASGFMYILAPKSVLISGDIQNILNETKNYASSAY